MNEVPELTRQKEGVAVSCTTHFSHVQIPATQKVTQNQSWQKTKMKTNNVRRLNHMIALVGSNPLEKKKENMAVLISAVFKESLTQLLFFGVGKR